MLTRKAITLKRIVPGKPEWQESITGSCEWSLLHGFCIRSDARPLILMPVKYRDYSQFAWQRWWNYKTLFQITMTCRPGNYINIFINSKGLFTWRWGTPGRWGNPLRWSKKSYNPAVPVSLSQDHWMVSKHVKKKNAGKPRVLAIYSLLHSLTALAATFSDEAFYWHLRWWKATAKVNFARIWRITNPTPARRVTPHWNVYN